MGEIVGRAGFHAEHTKDTAERAAIVHEMMRELDEDSIDYWAARNPNIVVEDEFLNEAYVNDGQGGFRDCTDKQQVLTYGDERVAKVKRKFRKDTLNTKTNKMQGGTVTTTMIVAHLPKSMCVEIPDYYPVLDRKTGAPVLGPDGESMRRSRWVARDRDEARRYFMHVLEYLESDAIPGGHDGVHGIDIQHSESTPHVQILADTFAEDPKDPDALRVEASQAWFSHRDVLDEEGKQKSGNAKMRGYHAGLKAHLVELGYDISPDFDEERHMVGYTKDDYAETQDAKRAAAADREALASELEQAQVQADGIRAGIQDERSKLRVMIEEATRGHDEREAELDRREAEIPRARARATEEGRRAGYEDGRAAAKSRADKALAVYIAQLKTTPLPRLMDDFLDRKDKRGKSFRPMFDNYVDWRRKQFEVEHQVEDVLLLDPGDLEQFIADGGKALAAEVAQMQRDRQAGD